MSTDIEISSSEEPSRKRSRINKEFLGHGLSFSAKKLFVIRVYCPGEGALQNGNFHVGLSESLQAFGGNFDDLMMRPVVETVSNDSIRRQKWSPRDLVDWLKNSNLHFIISHVHQANLTNPPHWEARNVQRCLSSLGAHQGFPMGSKLKCPIFTQEFVPSVGIC
jgi:hypothetical protein